MYRMLLNKTWTRFNFVKTAGRNVSGDWRDACALITSNLTCNQARIIQSVHGHDFFFEACFNTGLPHFPGGVRRTNAEWSFFLRARRGGGERKGRARSLRWAIGK